MDEQAVAGAGNTPIDGESIAQVADAAKGLRDTASWTLGAVTTVATALGATITFTGLENLDEPWPFGLAVLGLFLVVISAAGAISAVAKVLAPSDTTLKTLKVGEDGLTRDLLFGAGEVEEFAARLREAESNLVELQTREGGATATALELARDVAKLFAARAERIRVIALFNKLENDSRKARMAIGAAVLIATAGVVLFQFASFQQRSMDRDIPTSKAARDLIADFHPGALSDLPGPCAGRRRAVEVPGQRSGQKGFLLRPKGADCPSLYVRVSKDDVTTRPARTA